jgi:lysine 6-dehydrogenase
MKIAIVGAGRQAEAVCYDLISQDDVDRVMLLDVELNIARHTAARLGDPRIEPAEGDAEYPSQLAQKLKAFGPSAILAATPPHLNLNVVIAALEVPCHVSDLGASNEVVNDQKAHSHRAIGAGVSIVTGTGCVPGLPGHIVADAVNDFDSVESAAFYTGGIPQNRNLLLGYTMTFAAEGVVDEYDGHSKTLSNGKIVPVEALTKLDPVTFPAPFGELEAFVTSWGLPTLPETFAGQIQTITNATLRYPGHIDFFIAAKKMGLFGNDEVEVDGVRIRPRRLLEKVMTTAFDTGEPDALLMRAEFKGLLKGKPVVRTYEMIEYPTYGFPALVWCTAVPASIVLLMLARGEVSMKGFAPLELSIDPKKFLKELAARGIKIKITNG